MKQAGWGLLLGSALLLSGCGMKVAKHMEAIYVVKRAPQQLALDGDWEAPAWRDASTLRVDRFMAASKATNHKPGVEAKVTYTDDGLFVFFKVSDQYVVCRNVGFQARVYKDSCAEFFVQPKAGKGYFNFEMNCGGSLLVTYIEDARRTPTGFVKYTELPPDMDALVQRYHSMPSRIDPEQIAPGEWRLEYFIPFSFFERYVGPLGKVSGQTWRANFFKCADDSSHPHWATWAPLDPDFAGGFHRPDKFGVLRFE